jgi:uncharacterized protein YdhG (YjbR/CyaY superfamily)
MTSSAATVAEYVAQLPDERRTAFSKLLAVIRKNLPKGFQEQMCYGMPSWVVPHKHYPAGYHCDPTKPLCFASLAAQKNYIALYLMTAYLEPQMEAWIREAFAKAGQKLDMGKSCIRFKKIEDVLLAVIGQAIARVSMADYIQAYEDSRKLASGRPKAAGQKAAKKAKAPARKS